MRPCKPYLGTNIIEVSFILMSLGLFTLILIPATIATPPVSFIKTNTPTPTLRQESVLFPTQTKTPLSTKIDEQCLQVALCRVEQEKPVLLYLDLP
ncbi:hypothetical protein [Thioflexithrix psekupsensis]|uniref:Uncharacterized protein n=1 Tax=Thioflexithrix psekupsensis TaxID=1570016 RepID=A0A251X8W0_9GAMM|nr:hypothetical protein [Thioflexithrix psekupsensis]OUD14436.1 hypothetical protein TPSD3_09010 [Thioflexithrix psekupsensis]